MAMTKVVTAALLLAALLPPQRPAAASAQAPGIMGSYQQAQRLLDRAIAAHGGLEAMRRARRVHIRFAGESIWRHQSRKPEPPYDRGPARGALRIDLDAGRLTYDLSRSYPGEIPRHFRFATGERDHYVNHRNRTYTPDDYPPPDEQLNNIYYVPQLILLMAHDSGTRLRSLGVLRLASGVTVDAITTSTASGSMTIGLDPDSHQLRSLMLIRGDAVAGQVATETEFVQYRDVDGVPTPGRRTVSIDGELIEDFAFEQVIYGESVPDALVNPPDGYVLRPASEETPAVRALADNVWLVGGNAASLVVSLGADVIVIDASPGAANVVSAQVPKLLPGRKVTNVVPTHHHDDHAPGIRALAREGATVIASPGNREFFERLIDRPVQIMSGGRHVFGAGDRTLEIHNVGPSPHAEEMLIAWLPKEGILFEADLIDVNASGTIESGANNATTAHFARWLRERRWNVKQFAGAHGGVIDAAAFARLVALPQ